MSANNMSMIITWSLLRRLKPQSNVYNVEIPEYKQNAANGEILLKDELKMEIHNTSELVS